MDVIKGVLKEQLEYALESEKHYTEAIKKFPVGSLSRKVINGSIYYYLIYREGKQVKTEYIGRLFDEEIEEYQDKINKRRLYEKILRGLRKEIRFLRRVLNAKAI